MKQLDEIVRAGAGAGKTTALISKILDFAEDFQKENDRLPKMVVSTFTRKATQEIRERLMMEVYRDKEELLSFVTSRSSLHISTIHGVLHVFLQRCGQEFGLDPGFTLLEGGEEKSMVKRILRRKLLESESGFSLLESFDFETLVLFFTQYYQAWMTEPNLKAHTEVSLEKVVKKLSSALAKECDFFAKSVRTESSNEKWLELADVLDLFSANLRDENYERGREALLSKLDTYTRPRHMKKKPQVSDETAEGIGDLWKKMKAMDAKKPENFYWDPQGWKEFAEMNSSFNKLAIDFSETYLQMKLETGQLFLSDLESLSLYFLRKYPKVARRFSSEWDFWLVDEFQDTSPIQVEILEKLIGSCPSYLVGDPQQSIYLFRGARAQVFSNQEKTVVEKGGEQKELMKNYRSDPALLLFFNDFFSSFSQQFSTMQPREEISGEKRVAAHFALVGEESESELEAIGSHVNDLISKGSALDQICIVGRVNRHLEEIARFLVERGYPVRVHASSGFYQRPEIVDSVTLLKFLINPWDDLNLFTLLRSPWFQIDDQKLARWGMEREISLWDHIKCDTDEVVLKLLEARKQCLEFGYVQTFLSLIEKTGLLSHSFQIDPTGRRESNIWKFVEELREAEGKPGFNLLNFLGRGGLEVSADGGSGEGDAVASVEPERINLMTVHASKGLQFDHVIIPNLHRAPTLSKRDGFCLDEETAYWNLPVFSEEHQKKVYSAADVKVVESFRRAELEEQERLLYVAMTRAKKSVFLSWQQPAKKNSIASQINWDLTEQMIEKENYQYSVQQGPWNTPTFEATSKRSMEVRSEFQLNTKESNSLSKLSVSSLLEKVNSEKYSSGENQVQDIVPGVQKAQRGVLIHRLFETLVGVDVDRWPTPVENEVTEALNYVRELREPPMSSLLKNGEAEWGFLYKWNKNLIEGQIDLWGEVDGSIWVVDYKTGNPKYSERAFCQLALYGKVLSAQHKSANVYLSVLYPLDKKAQVRKLEDMQSFLEKVDGALNV